MVAKKSPAIIAKEAERCYELAAAGMSTRAIAEQMGFSQSVVVRRMHAHIKEHAHGNADKWREMQLADLMNLRRRLQPIIEGDDIKAMGQAADKVVRIWERVSKMLGTDAATLFKVEATNVSRESDALEVQKMLDALTGSSGSNPKTIAGEVITTDGYTRPRRQSAPRQPIQYAAKAEPADEFASEPDALEEFDKPEPLLNARDIRSMQKPTNNNHKLLRDYDDD